MQSKPSFPERQRGVEDGVLRCIKFDGECMSCYARLSIQYNTLITRLYHYEAPTGMFNIHQSKLHLLTSPESTGRAFRNMVSRKVLRLSEEDEKKRARFEEEYRSYHSPKNGVSYYTEGMDHWKES